MLTTDEERAIVRDRAVVVKPVATASRRGSRSRLSDRFGMEGLLRDGQCVRRRAAEGHGACRTAQRTDIHAEHESAPGAHDENIGMDEVENLDRHKTWTQQVAKLRYELYTRRACMARVAGIIIADTKFEFGLDDSGRADAYRRRLTPDSSRFWPAEGYRRVRRRRSFDKQYVRDYLETMDWDKTPPGPQLPADRHRTNSRKIPGGTDSV